MDKQGAKLLDTKHFHVIFTVPRELNPLFLHVPRVMYNLLFASAWKAVQGATTARFGKDARSGMLATLHTWGSNLELHPHLHCIVPAGALLSDDTWGTSPQNGEYLTEGLPLMRAFRGFFLAGLRELWENDDLRLGIDPQTGELPAGVIAPNLDVCHLAMPDEMRRFYRTLEAKNWNVRIEKPMSCIQHVVAYLARYVYRTAITNSRILDVGEKTVTFQYKKYDEKKGDAPAPKAEMILDGVEFLRRFVMHLLPKGLQRVRHFGLYAAAAAAVLAKAQKALGIAKQPFLIRTVLMIVMAFIGCDPNICPKCGAAHAWSVEPIEPTNPYHQKNRSTKRRQPMLAKPPPPKLPHQPLF